MFDINFRIFMIGLILSVPIVAMWGFGDTFGNSDIKWLSNLSKTLFAIAIILGVLDGLAQLISIIYFFWNVPLNFK